MTTMRYEPIVTQGTCFSRFSDLDFREHPVVPGGKHARMDFPNGYGVSVVTGGTFFYIDPRHPYELAVMYKGKLDYKTPVTDDVIGHMTKQSVTKSMQKVAKLPKMKGK